MCYACGTDSYGPTTNVHVISTSYVELNKLQYIRLSESLKGVGVWCRFDTCVFAYCIPDLDYTRL